MKLNKEPVVGFACSYDEKKKQICINKVYFDAVLSSGGIPVAMPYVTDDKTAAEVLSSLDGIIFAGGVDIDPVLYGEEKLEKCGEICASRDVSENFYVRAAFKTDIPILGICRGIQSLNVFLGGTLYQDIPSEIGTDILHDKGNLHEISIKKESLLHDIIGLDKITVNSYHHQAVKTSAPGVATTAYSADGVTEAAEFEGRKNALAVQFHPEVSFGGDENSRKIFGWFVSECGVYAKSVK